MKKVAVALVVLAGSGLAWAGCSQSTPAVTVRSLEQSGRATFLCVSAPGTAIPGQQLDACFTPGAVPTQYNYVIPHVISLVTQTARGEVAIVDVTAETVVDVDKSIPGYNFLPIGALPSDIVATPGGNASFVAVADPKRPGIFALPTSMLPLTDGAKPPTLGSWPACALPPGGAPSEILIVPDTTSSATDPGGRRAHCDGSPPSNTPASGLDIVAETQIFGRLKLVVNLPDLAEIDIIDAQDLLTQPPGSFDPCVVERRVFLTVDPNLPPSTTAPDAGISGGDAASGDAIVSTDAGDASPTDGGAPETDAGGPDGGGAGDAGEDGATCPRRTSPTPPANLQPHPIAFALADDGRLFVSDDSASVIHVVDLQNPCVAEEKAPLLPVSAVDPTRPVVSDAIAVSPLTSDGKRFVYASDVKNNGSLMVFDVSLGSTERTPILRQDRLFNPLEPPDRVVLSSSIRSMTFATHEVPLGQPDPVTGVIPRGVPCDPTNPTDPNRPPDDFLSAGAQPRRLRGTFAFLALSSGDMSVIDLDDFDQACRRPRYSDDPVLGCGGTTIAPAGLPSASQEVSCNIVERHRPRSASFFTNVDAAGRHAPAMLTFPVLYDKDGTAINIDPSRAGTLNLPKLLGPSLEGHDPASWPLLATVLSSVAAPGAGLEAAPGDALVNWVTFDLREPRAHPDQAWNVTYEGALPWFSGRRGRLQCAADKRAIDCEQGDDPSHLQLFDSAVGFCDGGAQGADMAPPGAAGDILEIIDDMPDPADPYWSTVTDSCSRQDCEQVFGTLDAPRVVENGEPVGRDIAIAKSYQGKLDLQSSVGTGGRRAPVTCCFPYPVAYTIRGGKQWIVTGQASGFAHRLIPDPAATDATEAACVESCDPTLALRNGRVVARLPTEEVLKYDDPAVFHNAQLRFVLWQCAKPPTDANGVPGPCAENVRDRFFSFQEAGGFVPMRFGLSSASLVLPESVRYVRGLQMLAIPDPVAMGLMLFDLNRLVTTASFY